MRALNWMRSRRNVQGKEFFAARFSRCVAVRHGDAALDLCAQILAAAVIARDLKCAIAFRLVSASAQSYDPSMLESEKQAVITRAH